MPETRIEGKMYPSGHSNQGIHEVIELLEDWFHAIEDSSVVYRLPDPNYRRSRERETWTEEELERLVKDIDAEIDQEVGRAPGTSTGSKLGSGFRRLAIPQRLALAQQLDSLVMKYEGAFPATVTY